MSTYDMSAFEAMQAVGLITLMVFGVWGLAQLLLFVIDWFTSRSDEPAEYDGTVVVDESERIIAVGTDLEMLERSIRAFKNTNSYAVKPYGDGVSVTVAGHVSKSISVLQDKKGLYYAIEQCSKN